LDAAERQSLVCVRSLGRAGLRVGAFDVREAPSFRSAYASVRGILPDFVDDPDRFVDGVLDVIARHRPRVVIAAHDGSIDALEARRKDLDGTVALALARKAALDIAIDKEQTFDLARRLGVPVPRMVAISPGGNVREALAEVDLPVVVKPLRSWMQGAGARLHSKVAVHRREAVAAIDDAHRSGASVVLQEWLPGRREAVWAMRVDGKLVVSFAQVAKRMYPPLGGCSVVRESIAIPRDIAAYAEVLLAEAGLDGFSEVEFRRDRQGRAVLMEINPRLSASIELAVRAGVDFPFLIYAWAAGLPLPEPRPYRVGVRMRWLGGDVRWLRANLSRERRPDLLPPGRALTHFVADCFRPAGYDYLIKSDLGPAVSATSGFFVDAFARALDRSKRGKARAA
jgi:predicted ATP-grasp superfamily ATP-dependent carboligase